MGQKIYRSLSYATPERGFSSNLQDFDRGRSEVTVVWMCGCGAAPPEAGFNEVSCSRNLKQGQRLPNKIALGSFCIIITALGHISSNLISQTGC